MAYKMGIDLETIQSVIRSFKGVEHRIEYVNTINGVRFYNDSKATNTHAACAALSAFDKNVILLCGGKDKHISFDDLNSMTIRSNIVSLLVRPKIILNQSLQIKHLVKR